MNSQIKTQGRARSAALLWGAVASAMPALAAAQSSPFLTGAMAMANRISWGWCIGAILGIAIAFGAPQIVAWVRGMFGV